MFSLPFFILFCLPFFRRACLPFFRRACLLPPRSFSHPIPLNLLDRPCRILPWISQNLLWKWIWHTAFQFMAFRLKCRRQPKSMHCYLFSFAQGYRKCPSSARSDLLGTCGFSMLEPEYEWARFFCASAVWVLQLPWINYALPFLPLCSPSVDFGTGLPDDLLFLLAGDNRDFRQIK